MKVGLIYCFWDLKIDSLNGFDNDEFYLYFDGELFTDDSVYWSMRAQRSLNGKPNEMNYFFIRTKNPFIVRLKGSITIWIKAHNWLARSTPPLGNPVKVEF